MAIKWTYDNKEQKYYATNFDWMELSGRGGASKGMLDYEVRVSIQRPTKNNTYPQINFIFRGKGFNVTQDYVKAIITKIKPNTTRIYFNFHNDMLAQGRALTKNGGSDNSNTVRFPLITKTEQDVAEYWVGFYNLLYDEKSGYYYIEAHNKEY